MKEPVSSVTNVAYGVAGLVVLAQSGGPVAGAFAGSCLFLAVGSGLFHRIGGRWNQALDEIAMYTVALSLVAAGVEPFIGTAPALLVWFVPAYALAVFFASPHVDSHVLVPTLAGLVGLLVGIHAGPARGLVVVAVFGAAGALRFFGERFPGTRLHDAVHGVWHIVTAADLGYAGFLLL